MSRTTSFVGACCLALLLPSLADAQGSNLTPSGAADISARLTGRPLAAATYAAVPALPADSVASSAAQACRTDAMPDGESQDSRWQWRLRAFRHLDCVTTLIDNVLAAGGEDDEAPREVRISREDLERIRTLAWWARDAAARIGQ
jgi:hypothetical protein